MKRRKKVKFNFFLGLKPLSVRNDKKIKLNFSHTDSPDDRKSVSDLPAIFWFLLKNIVSYQYLQIKKFEDTNLICFSIDNLIRFRKKVWEIIKM